MSDTTKGNGALSHPVGLITADEIVAAGSGFYNKYNRDFYLYHTSSGYWSMTPLYWNGYNNMFFTGYNSLNSKKGESTAGYAPVINLKPEYVSSMIGTGTMTDPYRAVGESA